MAQVLDAGRYFGTLVRAWDLGTFSLQVTRYAGDESVPVHSHKLPYVCFVLHGAYRERSGAGDRGCDAGTVLVHAGGTRHSDRFDADGGVCLNVSWDGDGGAALLRRAGRALPAGSWRGARIERLAADLADAALARRAPADDVVEQRLGDLAEELVEESARRPDRGEPDWLERVETALRSSSESPGVRELARIAGVHRTTLLRGFWRHRGSSVRAAIGRGRLDRAVEALLHTRDPLADVAQRCGFADQSHLCRSLRAAMGTSPARARASCVQDAAGETA